MPSFTSSVTPEEMLQAVREIQAMGARLKPKVDEFFEALGYDKAGDNSWYWVDRFCELGTDEAKLKKVLLGFESTQEVRLFRELVRKDARSGWRDAKGVWHQRDVVQLLKADLSGAELGEMQALLQLAGKWVEGDLPQKLIAATAKLEAEKHKKELKDSFYDSLPRLAGMITTIAIGTRTLGTSLGVTAFGLGFVGAYGTIVETLGFSFSDHLRGIEHDRAKAIALSVSDNFSAALSLFIGRAVAIGFQNIYQRHLFNPLVRLLLGGLVGNVFRGMVVNNAIAGAHALINWDDTFGYEDVAISTLSGGLGGLVGGFLQKTRLGELAFEVSREFFENIAQAKLDRYSDGSLTVRHMMEAGVLSFAEVGGSLKGHRGALNYWKQDDRHHERLQKQNDIVHATKIRRSLHDDWDRGVQTSPVLLKQYLAKQSPPDTPKLTWPDPHLKPLTHEQKVHTPVVVEPGKFTLYGKVYQKRDIDHLATVFFVGSDAEALGMSTKRYQTAASIFTHHLPQLGQAGLVDPVRILQLWSATLKGRAEPEYHAFFEKNLKHLIIAGLFGQDALRLVKIKLATEQVLDMTKPWFKEFITHLPVMARQGLITEEFFDYIYQNRYRSPALIHVYHALYLLVCKDQANAYDELVDDFVYHFPEMAKTVQVTGLTVIDHIAKNCPIDPISTSHQGLVQNLSLLKPYQPVVHVDRSLMTLKQQAQGFLRRHGPAEAVDRSTIEGLARRWCGRQVDLVEAAHATQKVLAYDELMQENKNKWHYWWMMVEWGKVWSGLSWKNAQALKGGRHMKAILDMMVKNHPAIERYHSGLSRFVGQVAYFRRDVFLDSFDQLYHAGYINADTVAAYREGLAAHEDTKALVDHVAVAERDLSWIGDADAWENLTLLAYPDKRKHFFTDAMKEEESVKLLDRLLIDARPDEKQKIRALSQSDLWSDFIDSPLFDYARMPHPPASREAKASLRAFVQRLTYNDAGEVTLDRYSELKGVVSDKFYEAWQKDYDVFIPSVGLVECRGDPLDMAKVKKWRVNQIAREWVNRNHYGKITSEMMHGQYKWVVLRDPNNQKILRAVRIEVTLDAKGQENILVKMATQEDYQILGPAIARYARDVLGLNARQVRWGHQEQTRREWPALSHEGRVYSHYHYPMRLSLETARKLRSQGFPAAAGDVFRRALLIQNHGLTLAHYNSTEGLRWKPDDEAVLREYGVDAVVVWLEDSTALQPADSSRLENYWASQGYHIQPNQLAWHRPVPDSIDAFLQEYRSKKRNGLKRHLKKSEDLDVRVEPLEDEQSFHEFYKFYADFIHQLPRGELLVNAENFIFDDKAKSDQKKERYLIKINHPETGELLAASVVFRNGPTLEIGYVATPKKHQSYQLGLRIVTEAMKLAREQGCDLLSYGWCQNLYGGSIDISLFRWKRSLGFNPFWSGARRAVKILKRENFLRPTPGFSPTLFYLAEDSQGLSPVLAQPTSLSVKETESVLAPF